MVEKRNKFLELCTLRRSVRRFDSRSIPSEDIEYIIKCALLAPSACNAQPWQLVVVDDTSIIEKLSKCSAFGLSYTKISGNISFIHNCPVVLALCRKKGFMNKLGALADMDYSDNDIGIFGEHLVLAAADRGIGSCWLGLASEKRVRPLLKLPKDVKLICLIALGYPEGTTLENSQLVKRPRREIGETVHSNLFGTKFVSFLEREDEDGNEGKVF